MSTTTAQQTTGDPWAGRPVAEPSPEGADWLTDADAEVGDLEDDVHATLTTIAGHDVSIQMSRRRYDEIAQSMTGSGYGSEPITVTDDQGWEHTLNPSGFAMVSRRKPMPEWRLHASTQSKDATTDALGFDGSEDRVGFGSGTRPGYPTTITEHGPADRPPQRMRAWARTLKAAGFDVLITPVHPVAS